MSAGPKRHRITIQRVERVENAYGEAVESWVDDVTLWASIDAIRGNETFKAQTFFGSYGYLPQIQAEVDTRIRIRHREGINPGTNRVLHKGILYDILAILPDNWKRETMIMAKITAVQQPDGSTVNA